MNESVAQQTSDGETHKEKRDSPQSVNAQRDGDGANQGDQTDQDDADYRVQPSYDRIRPLTGHITAVH